MHQAISMHADVDESAESGHIRDLAVEHHSRPQILGVGDFGVICKGLHRGARIAPGTSATP